METQKYTYEYPHPAVATDAGEVNGRMFINEIGTGFDVSVLDFAAKAKKYCRGLLPYFLGVVKTLFRFRAMSITYSIDGGESVTKDAFVVAAANGGFIGGGIPIAPLAKADDGLLRLGSSNGVQRDVSPPAVYVILEKHRPISSAGSENKCGFRMRESVRGNAVQAVAHLEFVAAVERHGGIARAVRCESESAAHTYFPALSGRLLCRQLDIYVLKLQRTAQPNKRES